MRWIMQNAKAWMGPAVTAGMIMSGLLLFGGAPEAKAAQWVDCNRRIDHANHELHEAIEDYGYRSPQANHWRHELHEAYEECRDSREYSNMGFDVGYRDGMNSGQKDLRQGKYYQPERHDAYEDGDRGYHKQYGDKYFYKQKYREGFLRGYRQGFNAGWW